MKTILFQGDSITDASRSREVERNMGVGYPTLVSARMGMEHPGKYKFINRGISGDRIVDVYARIKADIINLKPDCMSILIGVNDVWHEISRQNGVSAGKFEKIYSMLIEEIIEELPKIKVMVLEPFVLNGSATNENLDEFRREVQKRAEAAKNVAKKFRLSYIPLQNKFDSAINSAPEEYWLWDGVHPTGFGHEIIAREWVESFKELK